MRWRRSVSPKGRKEKSLGMSTAPPMAMFSVSQKVRKEKSLGMSTSQPMAMFSVSQKGRKEKSLGMSASPPMAMFSVSQKGRKEKSLPELRKRFAFSIFLFTALILLEGSSAFTFSAKPSSWRQVQVVHSERLFGGQANVLAAASQDTQESEETTPLKTPQETKVYELLKDLHESELPFRIVVVGNGAILESTNVLGPTFKVGESPKTGASIVTFAAEDQSFEFHLMPAQIASCVFVERPNPKGKILRLLRLLNGEGGSVCSLILADDSEAAQSWYGDLTERYGSEIVF